MGNKLNDINQLRRKWKPRERERGGSDREGNEGRKKGLMKEKRDWINNK